MFKLVFLLRKRPDLSTAEFRAYYEQHHAVLGISFMPKAARYFRRYLEPASDAPPAEGEANFDVMTEIWFKDRATHDETMAAIGNSDAMDILTRDEANLFDASRTHFFIIDERETAI